MTALVGPLVPLDSDAQRAEEVDVLGREGLALVTFLGLAGGVRRLKHGFGLLFELIEADRRFEHEQDVEALLADVLYNSGYVF